MKKITLIIACICLVTIGNAQNNSLNNTETFSVGPKAGVNFSNVYDSQGEEFDADPKFGWVAGVYLNVPVVKYFGLQPELLFSQKGFKATGSFIGNDYTFTRTLNYVDLSLLLAFKPVKTITFLAGPQYSYLINKTDNFSSSLLDIEQQQEFDNDDVRKNTLCLTGGFDINLLPIVFGARVGFDMLQNINNETSNTPRYKNVWY